MKGRTVFSVLAMSLATSQLVFAQDSSTSSTRAFFPHVSYDARALGAWNFALQQTPGTNLNTTMWLSSLVVGIGERFELGTVPLLWFNPDHDTNFSLKAEFWRGEEFTWAFLNSLMQFHLRLPPDDVFASTQPKIRLESTTLVTTYRPREESWVASFFGTASQTYIDGVNDLIRLYTLRTQVEHGLDVQFPVGGNGDQITLGVGRLREAGITAYEGLETRAGFTYTWDLGQEAWLQYPQLGLSLNPGNRNLRWLFNARF